MVDTGGTITATKTGGTVTAMNAPGYPRGTVNVDLSNVTVGFLADAIMMLEIKAGESKNHGDITFSCAADGRDCVVMVMVQNGTITATSTGGDVTASDAIDPNTLWDQKLDMGIKSGHSMNWPGLQDDGTPLASLQAYVAKTDAAVAEIAEWTLSVHELVTPATDVDTLVIYSNTDFLTPRDFAEVLSRTSMTMGRGL